MAKIAIDCDGVLANFLRGFYTVAKQMYPDKLLDVDYQPKGWDDVQGMTHSEQNDVWKRINGTPNWWVSLDAYPESLTALAWFLHGQKGHDVYIVTARAKNVGQTTAFQTDWWLKACGIGAVSNYLAVLAVEDWHNKRTVYEAANFEYSVDDKKETVEDCDKIPGHKAFLLDQNWNQDAQVKRRIKTLQQFFDNITLA